MHQIGHGPLDSLAISRGPRIGLASEHIQQCYTIMQAGSARATYGTKCGQCDNVHAVVSKH